MADESCELCVCFLAAPPAEPVGPLVVGDVPDLADEVAPAVEGDAAKAERIARKAARVAKINAVREGAAAALGADPPKPSGTCRCLPTSVGKHAADWCYQFSARKS